MRALRIPAFDAERDGVARLQALDIHVVRDPVVVRDRVSHRCRSHEARNRFVRQDERGVSFDRILSRDGRPPTVL